MVFLFRSGLCRVSGRHCLPAAPAWLPASRICHHLCKDEVYHKEGALEEQKEVTGEQCGS